MSRNGNVSRKVLTGHTLQGLRQEAFSRATDVSETVPGSVMYLKKDAAPSEDIRESWRERGREIKQNIVTMDDIVDMAYDREFIASHSTYFTVAKHRQVVDAAIHRLPDGHRFSPTTGSVTSGHLRQLRDLVTLMEFAGLLTPDEIRNRLEKEKLHNLASDIASLKEEFEEVRREIAENTEVEKSLRAERYMRAVEETGFSDVYPNVDAVVVGEFDRFSPVEKGFMEWVSAGDVHVYALVPRFSEGTPSGVERTLSQVWRIYTDHLGFDVEQIGSANSESGRAAVDPSVFRGYYKPTTEETGEVGDQTRGEDVLGDSLEAVAPMDADHEVRYISRRTQGLLDDGVDPDEIGVIVTDTDYVEEFRTAAKERRLPSSISFEVNIKETFVGAAFLDALDIIDDPTDEDVLVNLLRNPTTGTEGIRYREIATRLSETEVDNLGDLVEPDGDIELSEDLDDTELGFLTQVIKEASEASDSDDIRAVFDLLGSFGLNEDRVNDLDAADSEAWEGIERTVKAVEERFDVYEGSKSTEEKPDWVAAVRRAMGNITARVPQGNETGAVDVRSINNTEGSTYDYVFVCGLTETQYPSGGNRLAFTRSLNEAHPDFDRARPHKRADYMVARVLVSAEKAVVSMPRTKEDGTEYVKSGFLTELVDRTGVEPKEIDEYGHMSGTRDPSNAKRDRVGSVSDVWRALSVVAEADGSVIEALAKAEPAVSEYADWGADNLCSVPRAGAATAGVRDSGGVGVRNGRVKPDTFQSLSGSDREPMSPSEMNTFAECGFKYYMDYVLEIGGEEEDAVAASRGTIVHEVLEEFYSGLQTDGEPVDLSDYERSFVERRLLETALDRLPEGVFAGGTENDGEEKKENEGTEQELSRSWLRELLAGLGSPGENPMYNPWNLEEPVHGTLANFVQEELTLRGETDEMDQALSTIPVHFEEFLSAPIGGVDVHGFVDRVDIDDETGEFVVRDYKTGKTSNIPNEKDILGGLDFQVPVYMRLADLAYDDKEPVAGTYYSVGGSGSVSSYSTVLAADEDAVWNETGGSPVRRHGTPSLDEREELHRFIREVIADRVEQMRSSIALGYFHPTVNEPDDAGCSYCDFRDVCDVREHRRHEMMSSLAEREDDVYVPQKTLEDSPEANTESDTGIERNGGES